MVQLNPGKLLPMKERMQDKMKSFSPIKELRNFSPIKELRNFSPMKEMKNFSPIKEVKKEMVKMEQVARSPLRRSLRSRIGLEVSFDGVSPKKNPRERITEVKLNLSNAMEEMKLTKMHADMKESLKKAFSKDVESFKEVSMEVLASINSPGNARRRQTNLLYENRQCHSIDLSVNLCGDFKNDSILAEDMDES